MKFIGTIIWGSSAFAVYSDEKEPLRTEWDNSILEIDGGLLIPKHLRLTLVDSNPAPAVLPRDLSPSLEDE